MAADFIVAIAVKIGEVVLSPIGNSIGYLMHYKDNINSFQNQIPYLENLRVEIQGLVDEARRNGEHMLPHVEEWLAGADRFIEESRKFLEDQINPSCSDLVSRYQVSKTAKNKILLVNKLLQDGKFDRVSQQIPPPLWSTSGGDMEIFDSRKSTFKEIMEALKDDDVSIVGVCGMGGVGKTTLVKEIAKQASEYKLFDEIAMAVVSQTPIVRNIQGEIADKLGLKFEQESDSGRAFRLCERLKQQKRVLVILDDLWRIVDLEAIGIPHGHVHVGCKLLLTSRSKDVCNEMNAQVCFPIKVLSEADAWNLFRKMASGIFDTPDIHLLATKVAERCAGLPIAIVTVARALRGKSKHAWSDALHQLQSPSPKNIKGMQRNVYSSLELSFNFLETDEMKSCFLLCSLFKDDLDIPIEYLVRYGMGLRLFQNVYKLEEARNRAYALIEGLKACCLLLDGKSEEYVRMHDVIRDFAILVASSGERMALVRHDAQSMDGPSDDTLNHCAAISLTSTNIIELPDGLNCPKLEILLLQCHSDSMKVPHSFFEGMKELRVLVMGDMPITSVPPSIRSLRTIRTLCLERCKLRDVSLIGELKSLEILSFVGSNIRWLPKEIAQLTRLRLLDLTDCEELTTIPSNVLSRLSSLECLYMMNSFVQWDGESEDMQGTNAALGELKTLSCLSTLEVNILDVNVIPRDLLFENLVRFKIYVGSYWLGSLTHQYSTALKLRLDQSITLQDGVTVLLKQAQYLILQYCPQVMKNVLYDLKRDGFQNLRGLELYGNCDIEYLVDTVGCKQGTVFPILEKLEAVSMDNLKEICHGDLPARSFCELRELDLKYLPELISLWKDNEYACLGNLRSVYISTCHKFENLFLQHTARDLGKLHDLRIFNCHNLQEIFSNNNEVVAEGANEIVLPNLKSLELSLLPELRSVCPKRKISTSDVSLDIPLFSGNVEFPVLEELQLRELPRVKDLWHRQLSEANFDRLKVLRIIRCHGLVKVIPSNMVERLKNLESLSVIYCDLVEKVYELEEFVIIDENKATSGTFPPLKELVLCGLRGLEHTWWNKGSILSLQCLSSLTITRCDGLRYIFSLSALKGLIQLQRLEIESCVMIEEIVATETGQHDGEGTSTIVFPQLHTLRLYHLPELTSFYKGNKALDWPSLKILTIANCPKMKTFPASGIEEIIDQEGNLCATIQPLFSEKVAFPDTEELHIQWMDNLVGIWHNQLVDLTLSRLQVLDIRGCDRLLDVGPTNMLSRLQMLTKLYIEDCGSVEEIFVPEEDPIKQDNIAVSLFSLTELRLKSLPKLRHIWWDKGSQYGTLHFQSLSSLEISGCDHLKYILSTSIANGLVQLQKLKISSCELVKEIVVKDNDLEDQVNVVAFPRAKTLELENLPNLKSFCMRNCVLQWPSLKELQIVDCPKMKMFSPILSQRGSKTENEGSEELSEHKLSIPTQPFFNAEVLFPILEKLSIDGLSSIEGLWHKKLPSESFCQLKILKVKRCEKLLKVVPRLKNLEKLSVKGCDSLKVLEVGLSLWQSHNSQLTSKLRYLKLHNLPKLVQLWWNKDHYGILGSPSLSSLKVIKCDGLRKIFSPFVVKNFIHLEELHIANCSNMEEVVAEDEHKGYAGVKVVFPQVHSLGLVSLPNLRSFCSATYTFEWPTLEKMNLEDCPNMHTFSGGLLTTPKLNVIEVENGEQLWKGDLNSTIQHLYEIKNLKRKRMNKERMVKKLAVKYFKIQKVRHRHKFFSSSFTKRL